MHRSREYECFRYRPNLNNSIKMHSAIGSLRSWMCTETPQPAIFIFFALRLTHLCSCVRRATERNEFVWSRNSSSWLRFQANHFCFLNFSCFSLHFLSFFHFVCCEQWAQCKYAESRQLFSVPCSYSMKKKKKLSTCKGPQTLCSVCTNLWSLAICWKENDCFVFAVTFAASSTSSVSAPTYLSVGKTYHIILCELWKISHCLDPNCRTFGKAEYSQLSHSKCREWMRDCNRIFI